MYTHSLGSEPWKKPDRVGDIRAGLGNPFLTTDPELLPTWVENTPEMSHMEAKLCGAENQEKLSNQTPAQIL